MSFPLCREPLKNPFSISEPAPTHGSIAPVVRLRTLRQHTPKGLQDPLPNAVSDVAPMDAGDDIMTPQSRSAVLGLSALSLSPQQPQRAPSPIMLPRRHASLTRPKSGGDLVSAEQGGGVSRVAQSIDALRRLDEFSRPGRIRRRGFKDSEAGSKRRRE
mgnify:CR=1 FL=1